MIYNRSPLRHCPITCQFRKINTLGPTGPARVVRGKRFRSETVKIEFFPLSNLLFPLHPENFLLNFLLLISSMSGTALQLTRPDRGLSESVEDACDKLLSWEFSELSSNNRISFFFDKSIGVLSYQILNQL